MNLPRYTQVSDTNGLMHRDWQALLQELVTSASLMRGIEVIVGQEAGMAVNAIQIIKPVQLDTLASLYTVPPRSKVQITNATAVNATASTRKVNVHLVPAGEAANDSNVIVYERDIQPGETLVFPEMRHALSEGSSIHASCDAAASVSFAVSAAVVF